eukprot:TRINITY_DN8_c0_g1_i1.p1 TRINITY_DN8_c0_g1~~TRINITY_DN8_c0_g1_i1.p1  ORF type:complete len:326 (+),score=89.87 TRINITY_DN8_c0_g1_i1:76-1053(+)
MTASLRLACSRRRDNAAAAALERRRPSRAEAPRARMQRRRPAVAVVAALLAALVPREALAEPCVDHPKDYNIVQFTSEECKCCYDLDEFIQDNDYVYVLFYSVKGRLNIDINAKFEQLAADWKWGRVAFGRIDTDKDRDMAKKWVEPHMVPTNVMYKFGRPVEVKPADFEQIRDKYQGSPEGQKWLLTKYMGEDTDGTNLHYVTPLPSAKKLSKHVKANEVSIVGYFKKDTDMYSKMFGEVVWKLHQDINRDDLGAAVATVTTPSVIKKEKAKVPSVVVYLDGKVVEQDGVFADAKWTAKALEAFVRQFLPLGDDVAAAGDRADL